MSNNKLGYIFIISAMLIWGSVGVFARFIPQPSEVIVFYRVLFAFISLFLISIYKKDLHLNLKGNNKLLILTMGVVLALNWIFFFKAIKITTIASATLSFLGLGVQPPMASWGSMIAAGRDYLLQAPWISTSAGFFIMLTVLGFNFIGDGLRDALDPTTNRN
jgi:ABC-type antimicrobial peptide transport system permease subunit